MQRKLFLGYLGLVGSAVCCWAQMQIPVLGYMPDGGSIRAIYGIPASGTIASPVATARDLAQVSVAPGANFAVAVTADNGQPVVVALGAGAVQLNSVFGAVNGADRVVLSPRGSAALVGSSSRSTFQVITGLPAAATVSRTIDASVVNDATAVAISDDGQWVVSASADGVNAYGPAGQSIPLPVSGAVTALAFLSGKLDVATTTASTVTMIGDIGGAVNATILHSVPPGTPMSADNNHLVLVEPSGGIGHINLTTGAVTVADCQCTPTGLFNLGGGVFRLTGINGGAAKVFDASSDSVWFVPQALEVAAGGAQ
jgi:hypothetical protein